MLIQLAHAKLILSPMELQVRLQPAGAVLTVMVDDLRLIGAANLLLANVGAVSWQLPLDNADQLAQISDFYGIAIESR